MRKLSDNISTTTIYRDDDYSSYKRIYHVKAASKLCAIQKLDDVGVEVHGRRIYSDYDCTGKHFCGPLRVRDVKWSKSRKCYVVTHRWGIDI